MESDGKVDGSLVVKYEDECSPSHRLSIIDTADKTNTGLSFNEKFRTYLISYEMKSSEDTAGDKFLTWRRYSEFDRLYSYLRHVFKNFDIPILPQKSKILKEHTPDVFDQENDFLFRRRFLLNRFLQKLTWNRTILDDENVQRFLTSKEDFHHHFEKLKIIVNLKSITFSSFNSNGEKESSLIIAYLVNFSKSMRNLRKLLKTYRSQQYATYQLLIPFDCVLNEMAISEEKCLSIIPNGIEVTIEDERVRSSRDSHISGGVGERNDIFEEKKEMSKSEKKDLSSQNLNVDLFSEIGNMCDIFSIFNERKFLETSQEEFLIFQQLQDLSEEGKIQRHEEFGLIDQYCSELERIDSKERHLTRYEQGKFNLSFHDLKTQIFKESTEEKRRRQQMMKEEIEELRKCLREKRKSLQICIFEGRKELEDRFKSERRNILRSEMRKFCQFQIQNCKTLRELKRDERLSTQKIDEEKVTMNFLSRRRSRRLLIFLIKILSLIILLLLLKLIVTLSSSSDRTSRFNDYLERRKYLPGPLAEKDEEYSIQKFKLKYNIFVAVHSNFIHQFYRNVARYDLERFLKRNFPERFEIEMKFFVGNNSSQKVDEETRIFGDVVRLPFAESYDNLILKHIAVLEHIEQRKESIDFVVKLDEDTLVNWRDLLWHIERKSRDLFNHIVCNCHDNIPPKRSGKWHVPHEDYPFDYYPTFCYGYFYLTTSTIVSKLWNLHRTGQVPIPRIDDVYVTGILSYFLRIKLLKTFPDFVTWIYRSDYHVKIWLRLIERGVPLIAVSANAHFRSYKNFLKIRRTFHKVIGIWEEEREEEDSFY